MAAEYRTNHISEMTFDRIRRLGAKETQLDMVRKTLTWLIIILVIFSISMLEPLVHWDLTRINWWGVALVLVCGWVSLCLVWTKNKLIGEIGPLSERFRAMDGEVEFDEPF